MTLHRLLGFALALVLGMLLAIPAQAQHKIAVGDVAPIATDWPHFVAGVKGFYTKEAVAPQVDLCR